MGPKYEFMSENFVGQFLPVRGTMLSTVRKLESGLIKVLNICESSHIKSTEGEGRLCAPQWFVFALGVKENHKKHIDGGGRRTFSLIHRHEPNLTLTPVSLYYHYYGYVFLLTLSVQACPASASLLLNHPAGSPQIISFALVLLSVPFSWAFLPVFLSLIFESARALF